MRLPFSIRISLFSTLVLMLTGCIDASNIKPQTPDCNIACYITPSNSQGAVLQLVVKAGSLQEEEHERGFAHFVEHMAFNDTEQYPKEVLFAKLHELGIEFGSHSNAFTDFDNTTYFLILKDTSEEQLETAISILAQWAQHVRFQQDVVDAEKRVLIEEWRYRSPKRASAELQQRRAMYQNSRYGERFPIGTLASIKTAKAEALQAFYQRWYQPNNMSVLVSGKVNTSKVKNLINQHFVTQGSDKATQPKTYPLNVKHYPKAQIFVDNHIKQEAVSLRYFLPFNRAITAQEQFESLLRQATVQLLEKRLQARLQDANGEVSDFSSQWKQEATGTASAIITANLQGRNLELATRLLAEEVSFLLAEGVSEQELKQWKMSQLAFYQQPINTHQTREMSTHHFLYGKQMLSHPEWLRMLKKRLSDITPDSIDMIAQTLFQQPVHWELQTNIHQKKPTDRQLADWLQGNSQTLGIHRPAINSADDDSEDGSQTLWLTEPKTTAKLQSSRLLEGKVKEWRFANGLTVLHHYSRAIPGKFSFHLSAEGGLNQLSKAEIPQARSAIEIIGMSGLRQLNGIALDQWLKNRDATLTPNLDFFNRGLTGQANSDDLEGILQLLHVALTEGRVDDQVMARYQERNRKLFFKRGSSPHYILRRYLDTAIYNNHDTLKTLTRSDLDMLDKSAMSQIYQDYFYGAQNYRLALVGDIPRSKAFAKAFKHMATLPASAKAADQPVQAYPYPKKAMKIDLSGSSKRVTQLSKRLTIRKEEISEHSADHVLMLTAWLNQQLTQELREKQGLTYTVESNVEGLEAARPDFTLELRLSCDPKQVSKVRAALDTALKNMLQQPPKQKSLDLWHQAYQSDIKGMFAHPTYLAGFLARAPVMGFNTEQVLEMKNRSQTPMPEHFVELLQRFLGEKATHIDIIWRPRP